MAKNKKPEANVEETKAKHPGGRPTIYTPELGERICVIIENNFRGLKYLCSKNSELPHPDTIRDWLNKNTFPEFSARYARAKEAQSDIMAEEMMDVAYKAKPDKFGRVEKPKLKIDTLKFIASKLKPKKYGDNPEKFLEPKEDDPAKTTKETISEKVSRIIGLGKNKKISGEDK